MSDKPKKTLPRIRTFAQDLEHDRQKSGQPLPADVVAPKAAAPTTTRPLPTPTDSALSAVVLADVSKISEQTHVPAFHELQKKSPSPQTTKAAAPTPRPNISVPVPKTVTVRATKPATTPPKPTSLASSAVIITDNKRNHQSFFASVFKSLNDWFKELAEANQKKKAPKYTVVDSERRKGVIQKATSKTGTIFTADNETLREEIRRRNLERASLPAENPEITWTPNTETGYPLLNSGLPTPSNVVVQFKKQSLPTPIVVEPRTPPEPTWEFEIDTAPEPVTTIEPEIASKPIPQTPPAAPRPVVPPAVFTVPDAPESTWEEPAPTFIPEPVTLEPQPSVVPPPLFVPEPEAAPMYQAVAPVEPPSAPVVPAVPPHVTPEPTLEPRELPIQYLPLTSEPESETEYELTTPERHYRIKSIGDVTKLNTNILSVGVVGILATIIILVVIGKALLGFLLQESPINALPPATPLSEEAVVIDVTLDVATKEALAIALQQAIVSEEPQQEFRIIDTSGAIIPNQTLLPLIGFSNTGSLNQTITEARVTTIHGGRGIIFTVTDPTTAFGSLLSWESRMLDNLGLILGINRPTETVTVTDKTIQNTDVRIFSVNQQELLVYGFIDANTVLIARNTDSFTTALGSQ